MSISPTEAGRLAIASRCAAADQLVAALPTLNDTDCVLSPLQIRTILLLLDSGYSIKLGSSDLKPDVYTGARELIRCALALQAQPPAQPEPAKSFLYHYHAMTPLPGGAVKHIDGTMGVNGLLDSVATYEVVRLEIAKRADLAHAPEKLTLCSLTLLNPSC